MHNVLKIIAALALLAPGLARPQDEQAPDSSADPRVLPPEQAPVGPRSAGRFAEFDYDRDGMINRPEAERHAPLDEAFTNLDENGDGLLNRQELDRMPAEKATSSDAR